MLSRSVMERSYLGSLTPVSLALAALLAPAGALADHLRVVLEGPATPFARVEHVVERQAGAVVVRVGQHFAADFGRREAVGLLTEDDFAGLVARLDALGAFALSSARGPGARSTWTVDTVCSSALACSGTVTSSLGWTANIYTVNGGMWYVKHDVPEWIPCDDGTRAPGLQVYSFYSAAPDGTSQRFSDLWLGKDETTGASGNCGRNLPLVLTMPVKISRTG